MNKVIENIYINELEPLIPPRSLKAEMPITASITQHIINSRETIKTILETSIPISSAIFFILETLSFQFICIDAK